MPKAINVKNNQKQQHEYELRLLQHLSEGNNIATIGSQMPDRVILSCSKKGISLGRGSLPASAAHSLLERHLIAKKDVNIFIITEAGKKELMRMQEKQNNLPVRKPSLSATGHPKGVAIMIDLPKEGPDRKISKSLLRNDEDEEIRVHINEAESPLAWLYKRRDRYGETFIDKACFEAGERFRRDMTLSQIMPKITSSWSPIRSSKSPGEPAIATETMIAARQRLHKALAAVDSDYAGILIDICGFLKGLEEVERERQWPPRSGKVVLKLALTRLAHHYGIKGQARGPEISKGIRSWVE